MRSVSRPFGALALGLASPAAAIAIAIHACPHVPSRPPRGVFFLASAGRRSA